MQSTFADKSFPASGAVGIHHMPVQIIRAATQSVAPIPLVCDSPHSGTHYPADFGFAVNLTELRKCEDTHVEKLWASVPQYGGTLLQATFPRSYIDPNRAADDIDQAMLNGPWPGVCAPSKRCLELGNGLVFSKTPNLHSIYQRSLSVDDIKNRIENYWQPYRNALDDTLQTAGAQFGVRWHLNLHSMPSNAYQRLGMVTDKKLADMVLGNLHGVSCSAEFTDFVATQFRRYGYSVALNDPYAGLDLLRQYGQPTQGFESLQIEINRAVYLDEHTREPLAHFSQLRADIDRALDAIAVYIRHALAIHPQL